MVDYTFYKDTYLGSAIPEAAFDGMASRAQAQLDRMKRVFRVESSGEQAESMALCAMAEALYTHRNSGLTSASVGSVRVQYDTGSAKLQQLLRERASIYLDIYRGVEV